MNATNPTVLVIGHGTAYCPEIQQLDLACRFYGLALKVVPLDREGNLPPSFPEADEPPPLLVVLLAASFEQATPAQRSAQLDAANGQRTPLAVIGITPDCRRETLASLAAGVVIDASPAAPTSTLWVSAPEATSPGFELRGLPFGLGPEAACCQFSFQPNDSIQVLATIGPDQEASGPAMLRITGEPHRRYLLARVSSPTDTPRQLHRATFGEILPSLLLLREVGGDRCWHPASAVANLTIDDPRLTEPYGCLSFPGLLEQMRRERFHTTIGFVPWNFDRNDHDVVALFKTNPAHYSIAIHGNNHDRYEFFRYESRPGDQQHAKPLEAQIFNLRQGLARMEAFHRCTGLNYDRVMVFPHGICPSATIGALKRQGFWATSNYSNVPLDEKPPADPAMALRGVNTEWAGFPAMRRKYPHNYSDEAIAIDLFLGNPVLFMAHQDLFFDGIAAFNAHARRVNERQPAVRWLSLGEISRRLHLLRWRNAGNCEVHLLSRHAIIENPRSTPVNFHFFRDEPDPALIERVTVDGTTLPITSGNGRVYFATSLPPQASGLVEIHYRPPDEATPVAIARRGFRNHALRIIADFRDLTFSRSRFGRLLTKKYYQQGKRRPTLGGLVAKLAAPLRRDQAKT